MDNFKHCFNKTMELEGGYVLHEVAGDIGGQTYAGIARKFNSGWEGWKHIDSGDMDAAKASVMKLYLDKYWKVCRIGEIDDLDKQETIYDCAVNMGPRRASSIAQACSGAKVDGWIGPKSIQAINSIDVELFVARYTIARIARRAEVVRANRSQSKFLLGWISRDLNIGETNA